MPVSRWGPFGLNVPPAFDDPAWLNRVETSYTSTRTISTTTATVTLADAGGHITVSVGATITIPANVFSEGMVIVFRQTGTSLITLVAGSGMTMRPLSGQQTVGQWRPLSVTFLSATECVVD
jgi:hypothetical protein